MCGECGNAYKYKGDLSAHVRSNCNQNKRHKCPHCPYRSYKIGNINAHVTRVHKSLEVPNLVTYKKLDYFYS